jgi:hypothetical protein
MCIGAFVIAFLLIGSVVSITADENNECAHCDGKRIIKPTVIHGDRICCGFDRELGWGVCKAWHCIRYDGEWHCDSMYYKMWDIYSNVCVPDHCWHYTTCCWYT